MTTEFQFGKPGTKEDYEALYRLMEAAFPNENVDSIVRRFADKHQGMTDEDYFMVKQGDKVVAGLVLIPQRWSIDGAEFKVAEMGCVGTRPEYRRRGLQRILNTEFDEYVAENGYDLCVLAGIPYFYRQFGYQYAVELDYLTVIDLDKLPNETYLTTRPFRASDIDTAQRLLEETQREYMVHSIRTKEIWMMQQETGTYGADPFNATVILEGDKVVAYYRWWPEKKEKTLMVRELAQSGDMSPQIAATIRREAEKLGLVKLKTKLGHIDAFSRYLKGLGAELNKPYAWQVKLVNPKGFLEKLGPVLERRLENSEFKGLTDELRMNFWKYAVSVRFEDGKLVSVEEIPEAKRILGMNPYASIQLFLGYHTREELEYMNPDFYIRDGYDKLIDTLFPRKPGYIHYCY